jgi:hypothetical protein
MSSASRLLPENLFEKLVSNGFYLYFRRGDEKGPFREYPQENVLKGNPGQGCFCINSEQRLKETDKEYPAGDSMLGFLIYV